MKYGTLPPAPDLGVGSDRDAAYSIKYDSFEIEMKIEKKSQKTVFPLSLPLQKNPYEHLGTEITVTFPHRLPSGSSLDSIRRPCQWFIRHPETGDYFVHTDLINSLTPVGNQIRKKTLGNSFRPRRMLKLKDVQGDAKEFAFWLTRKSAYKRASELVFSMEEENFKGKTIKKEHEKLRSKAKRFALGYCHLIDHDFVPSYRYYQQRDLKIYESNYFSHAAKTINENLKLSAVQYLAKFKQPKPRNVFEEYVNAYLRKISLILRPPSIVGEVIGSNAVSHLAVLS